LIYQFAGAIGVDPGPLTLRELLWMYDGHDRAAWGHTSHIMCVIASANRDPKKSRPLSAADFNPYFNRKGKRAGAIIVDKDNIGLLREMFTGAK
jgi:hypothetical protein